MKLIYVFDPLCGWCYGFSPAITDFAASHPGLEIEVVSGGMVTGDRVAPLSSIAPYLREAYKDVENRTGVKFGEAYLKELFGDAEMIMNSVPPSLALNAFKALTDEPVLVLKFAADLQKGIYHYGHAPESEAWYAALAESYGLDSSEFLRVMHSEGNKKSTEEDFQRSAALGVNGFPTVILDNAGELLVLSRGCVSREQLEQTFNAAIAH